MQHGLKALLRIALPPYIASRLLLLGAGLTIPFLMPGLSGAPTSVFTTWDGHWYLSIADDGYIPGVEADRPPAPPGADTSVDGAAAFFPLYPIVIMGLDATTGVPPDTLAVAISLLVGCAAAVAFAKLASELVPRDAAKRSVLLFCFFPGAFVLSLAYPEGLLILLACTCLLLLRRQAWFASGITAALASATRPNGLALTVSCAVAAFIAIRQTKAWRSLMAPVLGPAGFLAFLGYLWWRSGDPWYWFRVTREFWHDEIGIWPELRVALGGSHPQVSATGADKIMLLSGLAVGLLALFVLVILLIRARLPAAVTSYAISYEFLALLSQALAPRPRFIFAAFPFVIALGVSIRRYAFDVLLGASSAAMVALFFFYTLSFENRPVVAP